MLSKIAVEHEGVAAPKNRPLSEIMTDVAEHAFSTTEEKPPGLARLLVELITRLNETDASLATAESRVRKLLLDCKALSYRRWHDETDIAALRLERNSLQSQLDSARHDVCSLQEKLSRATNMRKSYVENVDQLVDRLTSSAYKKKLRKGETELLTSIRQARWTLKEKGVFI